MPRIGSLSVLDLGGALAVNSIPVVSGGILTDSTDLTFDGTTFDTTTITVDPGSGIDTTTSGSLILGTTNATAITIGSGGVTTTVAGDLTVSGTTTTLNTATLEVEDQNILVNNGGNTVTALGAGINIEGGTNTVVGYFRVDAANADELEFKAPTGLELVMDIGTNVDWTINANFLVESGGPTSPAINQDLTSDASVTFVDLTLTGLSAGSVIFASSGGLIDEDNSFFSWDATNKGLGLGTATPNVDALLDVSSTTQGSLPAPRMTTAQRNTLSTSNTFSTAEQGMLVYNTTTSAFNYWDTDSWVVVSDASGNTLQAAYDNSGATNPKILIAGDEAVSIQDSATGSTSGIFNIKSSGGGTTFFEVSASAIDTVIASSLAVTDLTSGRVTFAIANGSLADNANFVWNNSTDGLGLGGTPNADALLDVNSTTRGSMPAPRMTTTQRNTLSTSSTFSTAEVGMLVFNTTTGAFNFWDGDSWAVVSDASGNTLQAAYDNSGSTDPKIQVAGDEAVSIWDSATASTVGIFTIRDSSGATVLFEVSQAGGANDTVVATSLAVSDLTSGRVTFAGANGSLVDDADLTFSGDTLSATNVTVATNLVLTNLVPGGVLFTDGSDIVAQDTTNFIWNDSTNGLGLGGTPNADALLDVQSTTQGSRPAPRMTTTERNTLSTSNTFSTAEIGMLVYNTTTALFNFWDGDSWEDVASGGSVTLQDAYDNTTGSATSAEIILDTTRGALNIRRDSGDSLLTMFAIQNNAASQPPYFSVSEFGTTTALGIGTDPAGTVVLGISGTNTDSVQLFGGGYDDLTIAGSAVDTRIASTVRVGAATTGLAHSFRNFQVNANLSALGTSFPAVAVTSGARDTMGVSTMVDGDLIFNSTVNKYQQFIDNGAGGTWFDVVLSTETLTLGSIPFATTATGIEYYLDENNSNFFWDDTNVGLGLGTATPNADALLDVSSTTQGSRPAPGMTTTQRNTLSSSGTFSTAERGMLVYNTTTTSFNFWDGDSWVIIADAGSNPNRAEVQFTSGDLSSGDLAFGHSLAEQYVVVVVYDDSDLQIIPDNVTATSAATSTIALDSFTVSGTWTAVALA